MRKQFTLRDLLLLPLVLLTVIPCVGAAHAIGLWLAPDLFWDGTLRRFAIDNGFPVSFATGQIPFTSLQIPGFLLLLIYYGTLYLTNRRLADFTALTLLLAVPLVDAIPHGLVYLQHQVLTASLCLLFASLYTVAMLKRKSSESNGIWLYAALHTSVSAMCIALWLAA